jgi:Flp pilus assembly pilin Flp
MWRLKRNIALAGSLPQSRTKNPVKKVLEFSREAIKAFVDDESAQDLVEYALLTVFVAMVGALAFNALQAAMGSAYGTIDTNEQNLWVPEDP